MPLTESHHHLLGGGHFLEGVVTEVILSEEHLPLVVVLLQGPKDGAGLGGEGVNGDEGLGGGVVGHKGYFDKRRIPAEGRPSNLF